MVNFKITGVGFAVVKTYKLMEGQNHIGYFKEIYTNFGVELQIELNSDITEDEVPFTMYKFPDENNVVNSELSWFWVKERVVPPTRQGIEDNLRAMGMSEYDPLAIFHYLSGRSLYDQCWIEDVKD